MNTPMEIQVSSEIGILEGVILHTPGTEVENMTPENAERALYSDLLNLSVASNEYKELSGVLGKITKIFQVRDLLAEILMNEKVKNSLIHKVCDNEDIWRLEDYLKSQSAMELSDSFIEGVPLKRNTLTRFLSKEQFSLRPIHNLFFTRDASISVNNRVLIGRMASKVRERESLIMEAIFDYSPNFKTKTVNPLACKGCTPDLTIEGGDILIAREDILIIGIGARTTTHGVDFVLEQIRQISNEKRHVLIQELPSTPESFIHLDMVFTLLDKDTCMVYEPLILNPTSRHQTAHIIIENGKVQSIKTVKNLVDELKKLGMDLKPTYCGGKTDSQTQQREQWHSGANFFAVGPGQVIGYERNIHTIQELNSNGFEVIKASDIIAGSVDIKKFKKYVITIKGSELSRGGGGARCMTMPIRRKKAF